MNKRILIWSIVTVVFLGLVWSMTWGQDIRYARRQAQDEANLAAFRAAGGKQSAKVDRRLAKMEAERQDLIKVHQTLTAYATDPALHFNGLQVGTDTKADVEKRFGLGDLVMETMGTSAYQYGDYRFTFDRDGTIIGKARVPALDRR